MNPPAVPFLSVDELQLAVANAFEQWVKSVILERENFRVALAGGSTPRRLHELLAKRDLPWGQMHFFWGDERNVPAEHEESNYRMARETLLDHVPVPPSQIHPVPVNVDDPASAATAYQQTLRAQFPGQKFPNFDLVLLGMGDDAHTASLFPETTALDETQQWFVSNWVEKFQTYRYTLTAPAINAAHETWFLISGASKQSALQNVLHGPRTSRLYPSQLIRPTRWFVTRDAMPEDH